MISEAFAQAATTAATSATEPSPLASMVPLILIFVVFYFLMIRPHQKRLRQHQLVLDALKKGDKVITGGGIIGVVQKVEGDEIQVEIAEGVKVKVTKTSILGLAGALPSAANDKKGKSEPIANDR